MSQNTVAVSTLLCQFIGSWGLGSRKSEFGTRKSEVFEKSEVESRNSELNLFGVPLSPRLRSLPVPQSPCLPYPPTPPCPPVPQSPSLPLSLSIIGATRQIASSTSGHNSHFALGVVRGCPTRRCDLYLRQQFDKLFEW